MAEEADADRDMGARPAARWFDRRGWADLVTGVPFVWLLVFVALPFAIVLAMSFATRTPTSPPFSYGVDGSLLDWSNYGRIVGDDLYVRGFVTSVVNAAIATLLCLLVGYPIALGLTRVSPARRNILLMLVILPFWTSFLLRVYAWIGLLGTNSWFNRLITGAYNMMVPADWHVRAFQMMNTDFAVVLVMVYSYLPFMILPLYANLERLDLSLNEAAMDLGSRPFRVFLDVTLPMSLPGIIAGGLLVFIPASGELIIPSLVGNPTRPMIGRVISDEFSSARDWPMASAVAVALLVLLILPTILYTYSEARAQRRREDAP